MRKAPAKRSKCYIYEAKLQKDNLWYAKITHPFRDESLISAEGFDTREEAMDISRTILHEKMDEIDRRALNG